MGIEQLGSIPIFTLNNFVLNKEVHLLSNKVNIKITISYQRRKRIVNGF